MGYSTIKKNNLKTQNISLKKISILEIYIHVDEVRIAQGKRRGQCVEDALARAF